MTGYCGLISHSSRPCWASALAVPVQPFTSVTVTTYVPRAVALIGLPVAVNPLGPVQLNVKLGVPTVTTPVRTACVPEQNPELSTAAWRRPATVTIPAAVPAPPFAPITVT